MRDSFLGEKPPPTEKGALGMLIMLFVCMQALLIMGVAALEHRFDTRGTAFTLGLLVTQTVLSFGVPVWWCTRLYKQGRTISTMLGIRPSFHISFGLWGVVLLAINVPMLELLVSVNVKWVSALPPEILHDIDVMSKITHNVFVQLFTMPLPLLPKMLLLLLVIAVLPAIFEELFFRGMMQRILSNTMSSKFSAILITSLVFSLIHFEFYGFLVRFAMGFFLGYVFYKSQNILYPIVLHFLFNGVQVVVQCLTPQQEMIEQINDKRTMIEHYPTASIFIILASLALTYVVHRQFQKASVLLSKKTG